VDVVTCLIIADVEMMECLRKVTNLHTRIDGKMEKVAVPWVAGPCNLVEVYPRFRGA
jgi:hypothetical protein